MSAPSAAPAAGGYQNPSRVRAAAALGAFALLILLVAASQRASLAGIAFAAVAGAVAVRNWQGGLFITDHAVVIRNVMRTWTVPIAEVVTVHFAPGKSMFSAWGYVHVRTTTGRDHRVTALRRAPMDGSGLALAIEQDVKRRQHIR